MPGFTDVFGIPFCSQRLADFLAMVDLVIRFQEKDLALSLELSLDLAMQVRYFGLTFWRTSASCSWSC